MGNQSTFTPDQVAARLQGELSHWTFSDGAIRRIYRTHGWKSTLMVVNAIGHLCEAAWHHPELEVTYDHVGVALWSHGAKGITERDFALAAMIEKVITWQPGAGGGPLEGTPSDPRFAYLRYDS